MSCIAQQPKKIIIHCENQIHTFGFIHRMYVSLTLNCSAYLNKKSRQSLPIKECFVNWILHICRETFSVNCIA